MISSGTDPQPQPLAVPLNTQGAFARNSQTQTLTVNRILKTVLLIETVLLDVRTFNHNKTSTLNRKPVHSIRPVLLIEQYL